MPWDGESEMSRDPAGTAYHGIVVFGNYRYGSSVLCDSLRNYMFKHGKPVMEWSELLAPNKYLVRQDDALVSRSLSLDHITFETGQISLNKRPEPAHVARSKLLYLREMYPQQLVILKLAPNDFYGHGADLIDEHIMSDARVYKLGLNRRDVGNALISFAIGHYHNIWNETAHGQQMKWAGLAKPVAVEPGLLQYYADLVINHNNWLYFNMHRLDALVWYDQLHDLRIHGIGYAGGLITDIVPQDMDHTTRAKRCFTNSEQLLEFAKTMQDTLSPMVDNVRRLSEELGKSS